MSKAKKQTFELMSKVILKGGETLPAGHILELEVDDEGVVKSPLYVNRVRRLNVAASADEGVAQVPTAELVRLVEEAGKEAKRITDEALAEAEKIKAAATTPPPPPPKK